MRFGLLAVFLFIFFVDSNAQVDVSILNQNSSASFISNKGQVADRDGSAREDVLYKSENKGIYLRSSGISYVFSNMQEVSSQVNQEVERRVLNATNLIEEKKEKVSADVWAETEVMVQQIDMDFVDCNSDYFIRESSPSSDYFNFYLPSCPNGLLNVHGYTSVTYEGLYDGIDVLFYGQYHQSLKYDFVIKPFADPNQIKLKWTGADRVYLDQNGQLVLANRIQEMVESIPLAYQLIDGDTVKIEVNYKLESSTKEEAYVSFEIGEYDINYSVVIDPWITNFGGEEEEANLNVCTDADGNIYIAGATNSLTGISFAGFQMVYGGGFYDAFIVKFNADGDRLWSTYYGGLQQDRAMGVAAYANTHVFLAGFTESSEGIAESGFQNTIGGSFDAFLVKFDASGARIWGTYYGGELEDYGNATAVDLDGNSYVGGFAMSLTGIEADGFQPFLSGLADAFLVKFDPAGNRLWGTYYGGVYADIFHAIEIDNDLNVLVTGVTTSADLIASPGAFQEVIGGGQDAFVVKFEPGGDRLWGTYFGSLWVERGDAIVVDTSNNIYAAGKTTAPTATSTPGAFQLANGGISDAFLLKLTPEGDRLWSTYVGGELIDYAFGVEIDHFSNNVIITGETFSTEFPVSSCAHQTDLSGSRNAFVTQFLPDGELFCSSYLGTSHEIESVIAIHDCDVYIAGSCTTAVATPGAYQTSYGGGISDAYLAKVHLASCGMSIPETITILTSSVDVTACEPCNGSATVDISDFCMHPRALKSYVWSNGVEQNYVTDLTSTIDSICEGSYWVAVMVNCELIDTFFFEISSFASITADFEALSACVGEPITFTNLSITDFGSIANTDWDFDDGSFSDLSDPIHLFDEPGIYEVTLVVTNDSECKDSNVRVVEVFPAYAFTLDTAFCKGVIYESPNGVLITASNDTSLSWNGSSIHGCDSSFVWEIVVFPTFIIYNNFEVDEGTEVVLPDGAIETIYAPQTFTSFLLSAEGCDSIIYTTYTVKEVPEPLVEYALFLPNIFSPGNDDANNTFYFSGQGIVEFKAVIVNRWGKKVAEFNQLSDSWDGENASNGMDCPSGVYFYTYELINNLGQTIEGQGTIQLVR
jgi:gliding motility-associated-like protein